MFYNCPRKTIPVITKYHNINNNVGKMSNNVLGTAEDSRVIASSRGLFNICRGGNYKQNK